jgi:hypothetical protein
MEVKDARTIGRTEEWGGIQQGTTTWLRKEVIQMFLKIKWCEKVVMKNVFVTTLSQKEVIKFQQPCG